MPGAAGSSEQLELEQSVHRLACKLLQDSEAETLVASRNSKVMPETFGHLFQTWSSEILWQPGAVVNIFLWMWFYHIVLAYSSHRVPVYLVLGMLEPLICSNWHWTRIPSTSWNMLDCIQVHSYFEFTQQDFYFHFVSMVYSSWIMNSVDIPLSPAVGAKAFIPVQSAKTPLLFSLLPCFALVRITQLKIVIFRLEPVVILNHHRHG